VTNLGPAAVTIFGISVTGGFIQTNDCGAKLAAQATCSIRVASDPTGAGPQTGSMTLMDDATNSPQVVRLSEKGNNGNGH